MNELLLEERIPLPPADVAGILTSRPATWLRPFLRLAVTQGAAGVAPRPGHRAVGWFRLGRPSFTEDGVVLPFVWRPQMTGDVFDKLRARIAVSADGSDTVLALEADLTGGSTATNEAVLRSLVQMLAAAMTNRQAPDG